MLVRPNIIIEGLIIILCLFALSLLTVINALFSNLMLLLGMNIHPIFLIFN